MSSTEPKSTTGPQSTVEQSPSAPRSPAERRALRAAGWGGLAGAVAYAALPLVNTIGGTLGGVTTDNGFIDPARIETLGLLFWVVSLGTAAFGVGTLLVVLGIHRLIVARTPFTDVTLAAGVLASAAWVVAAGLNRAMAGRAATSLSETGADLGAQQSAYQALNTVGIGVIIAGGILTTIWLVGLATSLRGQGIIGWGWGAIALLVAAILVVGLWVLAIPPAHLVLIPFFAAFAIGLLMRSRAQLRA